MQRREFIALAAAAATAWPLAALAQQRIARVGLLLLGPAVPPKDLAVVSELARLGYVEGRNVAYEIRAADGNMNQLPALARALVQTRPNALIGASEIVADALAAATSDIPIVMTVMGDPVAIGLTSSISRPSRNVTGFTLSSTTLAAKRLELLRELLPGLRIVAHMSSPAPMADIFNQQVQRAADAMSIRVITIPLTSEAGVAEAFLTIDREKVQAIVVETHPNNVRLGAHIIDECLVRDLPAIHPWAFEVKAGALMSYGPTVLENHAGAARYVDRILKGAKVADLPIEEPTQISLAINLRTARAIKLAIPPTLLARADEVIE